MKQWSPPPCETEQYNNPAARADCSHFQQLLQTNMNEKEKQIWTRIRALPQWLGVKIMEYAPAPDPKDEGGILCCFTIRERSDKSVSVKLGSYNNPYQRTYPRALERALLNIAHAFYTTFVNSDIQWTDLTRHKCWTAGLIGPLTRKEQRCPGCACRRFHSLAIVSRGKVPLHETREGGTTNQEYIHRLIQRSIGRLRTTNRIDIWATEWHGIGSTTVWVRVRKPLIPVWKVLTKHYYHKRKKIEGKKRHGI